MCGGSNLFAVGVWFVVRKHTILILLAYSLLITGTLSDPNPDPTLIFNLRFKGNSSHSKAKERRTGKIHPEHVPE